MKVKEERGKIKMGEIKIRIAVKKKEKAQRQKIRAEKTKLGKQQENKNVEYEIINKRETLAKGRNQEMDKGRETRQRQ